jgi:hypothetical protein
LTVTVLAALGLQAIGKATVSQIKSTRDRKLAHAIT